MVIAAARLLVAPPSRTPLPYGLLSVAQTPTETDDHWQLGVRFELDTCTEAGITTESCPATGGIDKPFTDSVGLRGGIPFTVYTLPVCSAVGFIDEAEARAVGALTSGEARAVEREFWTGAFGTTPHLAENVGVTGTDGVVEQTAAEVLVTGAVDVVEGIARIEEALGACYGNEGVIHVPPSVLTHMKSEFLVERDGTRLRSPSGHLIAAGAGYPGTAPDGTDPPTGVRWIYATGAVQVRRTGIQVLASTNREVLNRFKNDVVLVAERTYVIDWDCCHLALPINIGGITAGAFGS